VRYILNSDADPDVRGWGCSLCGQTERTSPNLPEEYRWKKRNCLEIVNEKPIRPWLAQRWNREAVLEDCENICPNALPFEAWYAVEIWQDYMTLGVLPNDESLKDQPAIVYEIIKLCEGIKNEIEYERLKKAQAEHEARLRDLESKRGARK
jgi:hypothetical protein